jgi:hypothetical protein
MSTYRKDPVRPILITGGGGSSVEILHFSHFHHVSLVQWINCLIPAIGGRGSRPGGATHTLKLRLLLSAVSLQKFSAIKFGLNEAQLFN